VEDHFSYDTYWVRLSSLVLFFVRLLLDPYIGLSLCIAPSTPKSRSPLHKNQTAIALSTPKIMTTILQKSNSERPSQKPKTRSPFQNK
jgi:hypothetical protein